MVFVWGLYDFYQDSARGLRLICGGYPAGRSDFEWSGFGVACRSQGDRLCPVRLLHWFSVGATVQDACNNMARFSLRRKKVGRVYMVLRQHLPKWLEFHATGLMGSEPRYTAVVHETSISKRKRWKSLQSRMTDPMNIEVSEQLVVRSACSP